jgi:hypothetical protein
VIGLRLTVPRRYSFERSLSIDERGLTSPDAWDSLRTAEPNGHFGFGRTREDWENHALASAELDARAMALLSLLRKWRCESLVSVGVGTGMLEYLIKRMAPDIRLRCGDFAPTTVELLQKRFIDCDKIEVMDLTTPDWATNPTEIIILHRVDMELRDDEWKAVFADLRARRSGHVVLVPCGLLTPLAAVREARTIVAAVFRHQALRPAGFLRTSARMRELFSQSYVLSAAVSGGGLPIWGLERLP